MEGRLDDMKFVSKPKKVWSGKWPREDVNNLVTWKNKPNLKLILKNLVSEKMNVNLYVFGPFDVIQDWQ